MQKTKMQRAHLGLHGSTLQYGRPSKDGSVQWAKIEWRIGRESYLPKTLFFTLTGFVLSGIKDTDKKSFDGLKDRIRKALMEAAYALGCIAEFKRRPFADVTWHLKGKKFFDFQIQDLHRHGDDKLPVLQHRLRKQKRFREMERKSGAALRGAIVVLKGGLVKFVPAKTRKKNRS